MSASVHDVAKLAGVSISTVSRVLNDTARVSEEKKRRVLEAVAELDYWPNPVARSLLKHRTDTIGAVLPFVTGEFFAELLTGLDIAADEHQKVLLLSASHRDAASFRVALQSLGHRVDGMIVMAPESTANQVLEATPDELPVVFLNTRVEDGEAPYVNFDNRGGMRAVTEHLVEEGHEKIAFVKGSSAAFDAEERTLGFRQGLGSSATGIEYDGDFTAASGYVAVVRALRATPRPTAIVASNDLAAMGVMRALTERKIRVPEEIAVAGFDDVPSARFVTPSLTSVHVPIRKLAIRAVCVLMEWIQGGNVAGSMHNEPLSMKIRESTKKTALAHTINGNEDSV